VIPIKSGKDVELAQGTEVLAWVDGDVHLKREAFAAAGAAPKSATGMAGAGQTSPQVHN
jgi:hypothetical protein